MKLYQSKNNSKKKQEVSYSALIVAGLCISFVIVGIVYKSKHTIEIPKREPQKEDQQEQQKESDTEKKEMKAEFTAKNPIPEIAAKAYAIEYLSKNIRMTEKNADMQLPPASLTKIMTAIVALERYDLDQTTIVPPKCAQVGGSVVGLQAYEVYTVEDLLYGVLVKSGADAACALASIDSEKMFVQAMNEKAKALGMKQTEFENEIGFDTPVLADTSVLASEKKEQLSSVNDILILSKEALKYKTFQKIVGTQQKTLKPLNSSKLYQLENTNDLLKLPGTVGIKTGTTDQAGQCLSYLYENKDTQILIVVLGSQDRFGDTEKLLTWAKEEITLMEGEN